MEYKLRICLNRNYLIRVLCLIVTICIQFRIGQAHNNCLKLNHLTVDNGLSSNRIGCIYRDSKDYLWTATDVGLDKYDSYQVKKYRNNANEPGSISSDALTCIYEDQSQNMWFGTSNGLNLYNPGKDNFKTFKHNPDDKTSISSLVITGIIEDLKGNLWIVSDGNCLNKWIPKTQNFVRYQYRSERDNSTHLPSRTIEIDSKGYLWIVSQSREIYRFDTEMGQFTKFDIPSVDSGSNFGKCLYVDNQDKIWIGTAGYGFYSFDQARNKFEHFESKDNGMGPNRNIIFDILPEDERYLLLAVDQGGINRFDKMTRTFEYIMYDPANENGINNNGIWCFHKDREGILWIGTSGGGINYCNPKENKFNLYKHNSSNPYSLSYNFSDCFYEDHQGLIWVGTDGGGLNVFDPETGNFKVFKHNPSDPYSISGNVIRCIVEDKDHDLWIGTWDAGLNRYDRKTGRFIRYMPDNEDPSSISGRTIWNLYIDHKGILWLGVYNVGVDLLDKNKGVIRRLRPDKNDPKSISSPISWLFYEDTEKNMWVCTENGLDLYDSITSSFKVYNFPDNKIEAIYKDKSGNLWVGTKTKGMFFCNSNGEIVKKYDTTNGLPDNRIHAIVEDKSDNLWISTNFGISQFNHVTYTFRNYSKEDGLQGNQFFQQSFLKTRKGEFYFGGYDGFNSFFPDSLTDNKFIPPVYITDFQIFNKSITPTAQGGQFPIQICEAKEITLKWNQSVFSFSFAAINYTNSGKNQYAFRMEGFEREWNYTSASRRYVTYTNLDPGEYTFRVKASNNDGVWNETGVSLRVIVLPPWWETIWFKILGLSFIIFSVIAIYQLRLKLYRDKQKELSILVEKRTEEITLANNQLVQDQILIKSQSDTIHEANSELTKLNETKDKILSIIGHDLRNPFNVISGFSDILLADYRNLPQEEIEMYLQFISESSHNGNSLLENLLQWSRTQTGCIRFKPVNLNLLSVVTGIVEYLKGDASKKHITVQVLIDPVLIVVVDENMIKTILRNLLSNAIKFTEQNGRISIVSSITPDYVEICVSDSGVGIPEEQIPLLFNINTNLSTRGTSYEKGTGLGLILCKEFVDKHNGKIWVESEMGLGSQFKFTLPFISNSDSTKVLP